MLFKGTQVDAFDERRCSFGLIDLWQRSTRHEVLDVRKIEEEKKIYRLTPNAFSPWIKYGKLT